MPVKGRIEVRGSKALNKTFVVFGFDAVLMGSSGKETKARRRLWRQLAHFDNGDIIVYFAPMGLKYLRVV